MNTRRNERDLLSALIRGLSPIPYWIGYKHERYPIRHLPELAIGAELRETLFAAIEKGQRVRCEVSYLELGFTAADLQLRNGKKRGRPEQADLVITTDGKRERPIAVIEVKRGAAIDAKALVDLRYLQTVRERSKGKTRAFFVLVTEGGKPKGVINAKGTANRKFVVKNFQGKLKVRRVLRAVGHAVNPSGSMPDHVCRQPKAQHWVVLVEVK